jgi:type VI protein secretion system component Hcp
MAGKSEILMRLVQSSGEAISAECRATLNAPDDLMTGFTAGKYFQIEDFSFGVGLADSNEQTAAKPGAPQLDFAKWRGEPAGRGGSTEYQLDVEPVSFTRLMDQASTVLFDACCQSQTLQSGTIVSRRSLGDDKGAKAYLRIDFTDVLIIGLDWDEGDVVKEKYKFVCRGVKMQFKPQASDGTLGAAIPGVWPKK